MMHQFSATSRSRCTTRLSLTGSLSLSLTLASLCLTVGCSRDTDAMAQAAKAPTVTAELKDPVVSKGGELITVDSIAGARFPTADAMRQSFAASLRLPARSVATAIAARDLATPLVIFETPDMTQLYSEYGRSRNDLARTTKIQARLRGLVEKGAAAGKELDDADVDVLQAESRVRENEAKLRESGLDPRVLARLRPGSALVNADLPESKVALVRAGLLSLVDFTSFPDGSRRGTVIAVSDAIDPQTRTARVAIVISNTGAAVRPGMFATVQVTQTAIGAVAVPRTAVVQADARSFVFVRKSATVFERREVTLGPEDGSSIAVLRGVQPGERIVSGNAILLKGISFGY